MNVGERIKQLRLSNELTLDQLASRCELTKGYLSQLENNITTPSLTTLEDIVKALGTNMSQFFKEEKGEQIVFKETDYFIDENEDRTITYIVPNAQRNAMEPIIIELLPGHQSQIMVPSIGEEFGYCLIGNVSLVNGKEKYAIKQGECFYLRSTKNHYLTNDSTSRCKILWICNPPLF